MGDDKLDDVEVSLTRSSWSSNEVSTSMMAMFVKAGYTGTVTTPVEGRSNVAGHGWQRTRASSTRFNGRKRPLLFYLFHQFHSLLCIYCLL